MIIEKVGRPNFYFESGMEGVGWIVEDGKKHSYDPFFIKDGDYVVITEKDAVVYEGFVFFNPYSYRICLFQDVNVGMKPFSGHPTGFSYLKWSNIFFNCDRYEVSLKRNLVSQDVISYFKNCALKDSEKEYEAVKEKAFSKAVSPHRITAKEFFDESINDYTGFAKARLSILLNNKNIGKNYYFIIEENVQDAKDNKLGVTESTGRYEQSEFLIPDISDKVLRDFVAIHKSWIKEGSCPYEEYFDVLSKFENEFKKSVKNLPVYRKHFRNKNKSNLYRVEFVRCVRIPHILSSLFDN